MNFLEKVLYALQVQMNRPEPYRWFHLLWIFFSIITIIILFKTRNKYSDKQLKIVLGVYGVIALILEVIKQLIWSFNYDVTTNNVTWDYQWYSAPFQLCTTPIFVSLICLFLKDNKVRKSLLAYMAFITILGGFMTIILPDSCFTEDIFVNIHTMWLHCGSFVVSIYLIMSGAVELNKQNLKNSFKVFLIFVFIAEALNIGIYNMGILNGETFDMFYISPYFTTTLPVFSLVEQYVPFIVYLLIYIMLICLGGGLVYYISKKIQFGTISRNKS